MMWVRSLTLTLGHTTYSVSLVLAVYFSGLAAGSFFARRISTVAALTPLRTYAVLEAVVGALVLVSAPMLLHLPAWLSLLLLFFPAFCMGATYPLLVTVGLQPGILYGINTLGAVCGVLFAGFYGIASLGLMACMIVAAIINALACYLAWIAHDRRIVSPATPVVLHEIKERHKAWLLVIGICGVASFVCEVAWTRIFASILGSSTYAFSMVLITFLSGLAIGGVLYRILGARLLRFPALAVFWLLSLLGLSIIAYLPVFNYLPYWMSRWFMLVAQTEFLLHSLQFLLTASVMILPTMLMGVLTPLFVDVESDNPGRNYGILTVGNIVGSVVTAFLILPHFGVEKTLMMAGIIYLVAAVVVILFLFVGSKAQKKGFSFGLCLVFLLVWSSRVPWDPLVMSSGAFLYGALYSRLKTFRAFVEDVHAHQLIFYKDGLSSTVSVLDDPSGHRYLRVNGKTDASAGIDMGTQLLLGYLPIVLAPTAPLSALVIGFGSGVSLTGMATFSNIRKIDCVEIEPAIIEAAPYFSRLNNRVLEDLRVRITIDDARHYLRSSRTQYDLILSEPSNPWLAGVANLYTEEAFRLGKERLSEKGIYCQWFHSYSMSTADFELIVKTFLTVFPNAMLFTTGDKDFFLIGSKQPWSVSYAQIEKVFDSNPQMVADLRMLGYAHPVTLLATTFLLDSDELAQLTANTPIHRDNRPTLEFTTPKSLQRSQDRQTLDLLLARKNKMLPSIMTGFNPTVAQSVDLNNMVGEAFMRSQKLGLADAYFSKALELDNQSARTWVNKGRVYNAQDKHLQAERALLRALNLDPTCALGWFHLGMLYVSQGMDEKGLQMLEKGLVFSPGDPMGSLQAGRLYIAKGNVSAAQKILNKALLYPALNPQIRVMLEQLRDSLISAKQ